ncbi:lytic transglycosylase domain-containing protein [Rufibacter latericius]|uniref:LysM peptidoglycan-binding domain-containing protein n=1 Tax=Rufibacter latericius TaxID=2487040 RepID=A0A3M9MLA1_9BACT|nr:lytic transglycosylase domain-containing protein [Rufibacter latericius]RNI26296.1 LysM peptidoglycan-binding domain-containing protein [Rufibacter latericius]
MRKTTLLTGLVLTLGLGSALHAQEMPTLESPVVQVKDTTKVLVDSVEFIPVETDELIQDRLSCLEQEIPLEFNKQVRGLIDYFTIRNRKYTRRVLERKPMYFPMFEKYLAKHNMPDELKYLAVVESALLPKAVSSAKAVGLWQFMDFTGREFRLVQNHYLDERMDPEKSTEAACKFLKQLYRMFGSWEMALAAYNCGPGNVRKAITRSGGKKTFWGIYPYLPKETRAYVPSFTALVYALNHAEDHNLHPAKLQMPIAVDTLLISQSLDLKLLAKQLNLPENQIVDLNPALKLKHIPENVSNFPLRIPADVRSFLAENRMAILDSSRYRAPYKAPARTKLPSLQEASPIILAKAEPVPTDSSLKKSFYTVRNNDNLSKIAKEQNVTVEQLKAWNKISGNMLTANQKLVVFKPEAPATQDVKLKEGPATETTLLASAEELPANTGKNAGPNANDVPKESAAIVMVSSKQASAKKKAEIEKPQTVHHVQPGDTLWNISKRYNNVSVEKLRKANKLKGDELKPGMKLIVG